MLRMKIWILHDSIYGNGERLARILANRLSKKYCVMLGYICNIAPESMVAENPGMIIFGSAIRFGGHTVNMKRWFRRYITLMRQLNRKLPYTFLYFTHVKPTSRVRKHGLNALKTLKKSGIMENIFAECVPAQVYSIEGPLCQGVEDKFIRIADMLDSWLNGEYIDYTLEAHEIPTDSEVLSRYFRFLHVPNPRSSKLF